MEELRPPGVADAPHRLRADLGREEDGLSRPQFRKPPRLVERHPAPHDGEEMAGVIPPPHSSRRQG